MEINYWGTLQVLLGVILVCTALRFAFPRWRVALGAVSIVSVAAVVLVPGVPVWLRVGSGLVAAGGAVVLLRSARQVPA